jgi:hypothetical protein
MSHLALALASLALIGVIAYQEVRYPPFRQETISQGLNGPGHVALDASLGLLGAALLWAAPGGLPTAIAALTALGLAGIAVTNTAWRWVDGLTGHLGGHERWHLYFTALVFASAFAFEAVADRGALWALTAVNIAAPAAIYALARRQDYAEKVGVLILPVWMVAWAVS